MSDQVSFAPIRAVDRNCQPVPGALLYTYRSGTMTALVLTDEAGAALAWPVVADGNGIFLQAFYSGAYAIKAIATDPDDVVLPGWPVDPCFRVPVATTAASQISFTATASVPETNVQDAIEHVGDRVDTIASATPSGSGLASVSGDLETGLTIAVAKATVSEAQAGTANTSAMTPLRVKQAIQELSPLGLEYESSGQTITTAGLLTLPHSLNARPKLVAYELVCLVDELGYVAGDHVMVGFTASGDSTARHNMAKVDATNVYVRFSSEASCFAIGHATTGVETAITNASWQLVVRAWV